MPGLTLTHKVEAKATQALQKKVNDHILKTIENRAISSQSLIVEKLRSLIRKTFLNHPILNAILGAFPGESGPRYDLQAEFGLTDDRASQAFKTILNELENTVTNKVVRVVRTGGNNSKKVQVIIEADSILNYEKTSLVKNVQPFVYESVSTKRNKKSTTISWMKFLLDPRAPQTEFFGPRIKGYGIVYGDFKVSPEGAKKVRASKLKVKNAFRSRSGRAIMMTPTSAKKAGYFNIISPYGIPKFILPAGKAKNFIDEVIYNYSFRKLVTDEVERALLRVVNRRQKLPDRLLKT